MCKCGVCGHELNKDILVLENMPKKTFGFSDETITLNVAKCNYCNLVQLVDVPLDDRFREVYRSIGSMSEYREQKKEELEEFITTHNLWDKSFLEVGCGDGQFLDMLLEIGIDCDGYEAGIENIIECEKKDFCVGDDVFFAEKMSDKYDVILSFHFLEHMPDPVEVLTNIYDKLNPGGTLYIEVPNYGYIEKNGLWLEFTRDHRFYYGILSMRYLLNKVGFISFEIRPETLTLKVIAQKPDDFKNVRERMDEDINNFNILTRELGDYVIVGAGHYTQLLLNKTKNKPKEIYDSVSSKIGKFLCGIEISPQDEIKDCEFKNIIISCGAYNQEAEKNIRNLTKYKNIMVWG